MTDSPPENRSARGREFVGQRLTKQRLLLGMVHLPPLPGSPLAAGRPAAEIMAAVFEAASRDATRLLEGGLDGFLIENFGDVPFYPDRVPSVTVAAMAAVAGRIAVEARSLCESRGFPAPVIGVNVLRNDSASAVGIAAAAGLDCLRVNVHTRAMVTDQGILEGRAHETLRERERLGTPVAVLADILVKHASPLVAADPGAWARETVERGLADAVIVTGPGTGEAADLAQLRKLRKATREFPLLVGSGVTVDTVEKYLAHADGVIVGTSLKKDGDVSDEVDSARVEAFVERARRVR